VIWAIASVILLGLSAIPNLIEWLNIGRLTERNEGYYLTGLGAVFLVFTWFLFDTIMNAMRKSGKGEK